MSQAPSARRRGQLCTDVRPAGLHLSKLIRCSDNRSHLSSCPACSRSCGAGGTGSEVMQRIAAPMVGGMITAPLLSMFAIPAAYLLMRRPREAKARRWAFWSSGRETA